MKIVLIASGFLILTSAWAQQPLAGFEPSPQTRRGWPLDIESIRATAQQSPMMHGLDLALARFIAPPDFTTRTPNPRLEIRRIEENREGEALFVTLRCHERKECGSFLTEVVLPNSTANQVVGRNLEAFHAFSNSFPTLRTSAAPTIPGRPLVQPRMLAQLVIEENGLRITELVLPAKRARLGEVVRVSDPRTHRSTLAEVTGLGLLRPADEIKQVQQEGVR